MANMNRKDRAKQFLPFNALRGFYSMVRDSEKIITDRKELLEDELVRLDFIYQQLKEGMMCKIVFYEIDGYITKEGMISNIDNVFRTITIVNKLIHIDDIIEIKCSEIKTYEESFYG